MTIIQRVRLPALKISTEDRFQVGTGLRNNIRLFIQQCKLGACAYQVFWQEKELGWHQDSLTSRTQMRASAYADMYDKVSGPKEDRNKPGLIRGQISCSSSEEKTKTLTCLYSPNREKGTKHYLSDCRVLLEKQNLILLQIYLNEKKAGVTEALCIKRAKQKREISKTLSSIFSPLCYKVQSVLTCALTEALMVV